MAKFFNKDMLTAENYNVYERVCTLLDTDMYIGQIGLEEAVAELLKVSGAECIGFYSVCEDGKNHLLKITDNLQWMDRIAAVTPELCEEQAIAACEARGIEPNWNGGFGAYAHLSSGSRRSKEGYTMGVSI